MIVQGGTTDPVLKKMILKVMLDISSCVNAMFQIKIPWVSLFSTFFATLKILGSVIAASFWVYSNYEGYQRVTKGNQGYPKEG